MIWTKILPNKPGYYWWRKNQYKSESIYYVFYDHAESVKGCSRYESIVNVKPENRVLYCRWTYEGLYDKQSLENVGGEWYGPLNPPN